VVTVEYTLPVVLHILQVDSDDKGHNLQVDSNDKGTGYAAGSIVVACSSWDASRRDL